MKTKTITPKKTEIQNLILKHRFLNRPHIQKFLNHKNHTRINKWLNELVAEGYLGRIYSKTFIGITIPAVYYLDLKGRKELKKQGIKMNLLNKIYKEKSRSRSFIDKCLLIADIYFYFVELTKKEKVKLTFYTQTDQEEFTYFPKPLPDAFVVMEGTNKDIRRYFLEIFDTGTPTWVFEDRIENYFEEYLEKWTAKSNDPFPGILVICSDEKSKVSVRSSIIKVMEEQSDNISIYLATKDQMLSKEKTSNIWQKVEIE